MKLIFQKSKFALHLQAVEFGIFFFAAHRLRMSEMDFFVNYFIFCDGNKNWRLKKLKILWSDVNCNLILNSSLASSCNYYFHSNFKSFDPFFWRTRPTLLMNIKDAALNVGLSYNFLISVINSQWQHFLVVLLINSLTSLLILSSLLVCELWCCCHYVVRGCIDKFKGRCGLFNP